MIRIELLKPVDVGEYGRLAREIILRCPHYPENARRWEGKEFLNRVVQSRLRLKTNVFLAAKEGGRVIGFSWGYVETGVFWLNWIGVDAAYWRQGVARMILEFLEAHLRKRGVHKIWCDIRPRNKASIAFFRKAGYRKIAFLKRHWYGLDFFLWEKFL